MCFGAYEAIIFVHIVDIEPFAKKGAPFCDAAKGGERLLCMI